MAASLCLSVCDDVTRNRGGKVRVGAERELPSPRIDRSGAWASIDCLRRPPSPTERPRADSALTLAVEAETHSIDSASLRAVAARRVSNRSLCLRCPPTILNTQTHTHTVLLLTHLEVTTETLSALEMNQGRKTETDRYRNKVEEKKS